MTELQPAPTGATPEVLYRARDVRMYFPVMGGVLRRKVGELKAVDGVSLDIHRGETVALLGESGCGKTTLGRVLTLLERPTGGTLEYDLGEGLTDIGHLRGADELGFRKRVQMIFQDPYTSFDPRQQLGSAMDELLRVHGVKDPSARRERVAEVCEMVNIRPEYLQRYPHEFSGGQRQRLSLARALTIRPQLIVADEVVSALDVSIQAQVVNILKSIQAETGVSFVFISHDVGVAQYISQRVVVMYLGTVVEVLESTSLHLRAEHPYTQALLSAVPTMERAAGRRERLKFTGETPSPISKPPGCPFSNRCPYVMDVCRIDTPTLRQAADPEPRHLVACHLTEPPTLDLQFTPQRSLERAPGEAS